MKLLSPSRLFHSLFVSAENRMAFVVEARNAHAAIYDALRLVKDL
jgi:hypothetical protein